MTRRRFLADLTRRWAKWVVVVGMVWCARTVYIVATTDLWWNAAN